jgi:endonuclease/exonuclease/phosphatase family metal-dependent hydrolase
MRRELIAAQLQELKPDIWGLNEIHVPTQTGRWLQRKTSEMLGTRFTLVQQTKVNDDSCTQAEGLLTRWSLIETANLDFQSHNCVALVVRLELEGRLVDVYITHLIAARVGDDARQYQVGRLLEWIDTRADADGVIVCGDFNAAVVQPSIRLMAARLQPTQTEPTAFTPLRGPGGDPTHPEWPRFDRCIDYIWVSESINIHDSGLCFNQPANDNMDLWPSDHVGVWSDLELS